MERTNNRRIVKNTIYLYVRLIISLVISLYTSRAFLAALGVEDYGIYNIVGGFVGMLSVFTSSITSAAQRFLTYELGTGNRVKLHTTFSTIALLLIIVAVIVFIIGEVVGILCLDKVLVIPEGRIDAAYYVFHCSLLAFAINIIAIPYTAMVTAHEKLDFYALVSIGESLFKLFIVWALYSSPYDRLKTYSTLLVGVGILVRFIYGTYCKKHFVETRIRLKIDKSIFKNVFSYSFWVSIGASSAIFKEQGVNVLINMFFGVAMNAARGVSMQVYSIINQFSTSISTSINPQITKSYAAGDVNRSINLTFVLAKAQCLLVLFLILPLIAEIDYILWVWLGNVPDYANVFTVWILLLCLARTMENSHAPIFLATGKVRNLQIVGGGIMLLNLPLSWLVLKMGYAPVSTVFVGVVIEFVVMFVALSFLKKLVGFPVFRFLKEAVFPIISITILGILTPILLRNCIINPSFGRFVINGLIVSAQSVFLGYVIVLNKREREMLKNMVKKVIHI